MVRLIENVWSINEEKRIVLVDLEMRNGFFVDEWQVL